MNIETNVVEKRYPLSFRINALMNAIASEINMMIKNEFMFCIVEVIGGQVSRWSGSRVVG
jgi:hypothetical protein